jgi:hypothetical protein
MFASQTRRIGEAAQITGLEYLYCKATAGHLDPHNTAHLRSVAVHPLDYMERPPVHRVKGANSRVRAYIEGSVGCVVP